MSFIHEMLAVAICEIHTPQTETKVSLNTFAIMLCHAVLQNVCSDTMALLRVKSRGEPQLLPPPPTQ